VPNPDETLAAGTGICFDYSALAGAMLRSLGLPCKVVTGYVEPADIYHSWNLVYINDEWVGVSVAVQANTWSIVDTTFAASAGTVTAEDSADYTQRYVY
jgi:transglutaminase/protease-like cytokinesis protein 3